MSRINLCVVDYRHLERCLAFFLWSCTFDILGILQVFSYKNLTMERHVSILSQLCRVGGKRFASHDQSIKYSVQDNGIELQSMYGIDISQDDSSIHPTFICILCQHSLKRREKAQHWGSGCGPVYDWQAHSRTGCSLCDEQQAMPTTRPSKSKQTLRGTAASVARNLGTPETVTPIHGMNWEPHHMPCVF